MLVVPLLPVTVAQRALAPGDLAPALRPTAIVRGRAPSLAQGVHVVEFWATWCGPCREDVPGLTELARRYAGRAEVTGVAIREVDARPLLAVKRFAATMGARMAYNVVWDGPKGEAAKAWMSGEAGRGVPRAFVVREGVVLWSGDPRYGLSRALAAAVRGTLHSRNARVRAAAWAREDEATHLREQRARGSLFVPVDRLDQAGDVEGAIRALDVVERKRPDLLALLASLRLDLLMRRGDPRLAGVSARYASGALRNDPAALDEIARGIVAPIFGAPKPFAPVAVVLSRRAVEATERRHAGYLATLALALYQSGKRESAVDLQTEAVGLARAQKMDPDVLQEMEEALVAYRKARTSS